MWNARLTQWVQWLTRFDQRCPRLVRWGWRGLVIMLAMALLVRSLPYLAPIRAADLRQQEQSVEFRDRHNLQLGTVLTRDQEHTATISQAQLSPRFIHAIISAEDKRFYHHGALDMKAIARSVLEAIQAREIVSGASTITMQLARMLYPSPRTLWGKTQEVWQSWRLVAGMTKDEILMAYINRLPMGGNVYGVEAAAQVYFGTSAQDLTWSQATVLASLPNDPTDLHPFYQWTDLKTRQRYVLDRLVEDGILTPVESDRIYAEDVLLQPRHQGIVAAPHFIFWLTEQLPENHPAIIHTTLDRSLQQFVETQVQQTVRSLSSQNVQHGAALVLDNHTGEVLAYVGSPDYFGATDGNNDGVQALRQPGSTLKPFLYQLALETGTIRPNTILADIPTHYAIPGAQLYSPTDFSDRFRGPVRVRVALANSLNVPAVRVLEQVGVSPFLDRLHQLGFQHLDQSADYYGLGLSLGSGEVSLWELAQAYLTMARQGDVLPLLTRQYNDDRMQHNDSHHRTSLTTDPETWALMTDMLSDRHVRAAEFGVDSILSLPFATAVKTGTSSDFRDTWTVGYSRDYTVATWIGNFDGSAMRDVSGVLGAAPLWASIMMHLHTDQDPAPFSPPENLVQRPICATSGLRPSAACPVVVQEYFYPNDLAAYNQTIDRSYTQTATGESVLSLPDDYDQWLATQSTISQGLRIASPQSGDYFITQPAGDRSSTPRPQLEFRLVTPPSDPVEWWLNGEKLATQQSASLFWPMEPGRWTLEVRSHNERDQVQFDVGLPDPHTAQPGFSVVQ